LQKLNTEKMSGLRISKLKHPAQQKAQSQLWL
jgi:hypothetical protein